MKKQALLATLSFGLLAGIGFALPDDKGKLEITPDEHGVELGSKKGCERVADLCGTVTGERLAHIKELLKKYCGNSDAARICKDGSHPTQVKQEF